MNTQTTMTRAQLFEVVWKLPLGQVADKLDIRTPDLARICASHRIPRPTSGHWTQTRHGIVFPPPTLEPVNDPRLETIDLSPIQSAGADTPERHAIDDEVNAVIIEELNRPPIKVPEILQNPHPFVAAVLADDAARAARKSKRTRRPTYSDIARDSAEPRARANVSAPKALKDRAY